MTRQALSNGQWFDTDAARCWTESTWWDGHNRIGNSTGTQWDHETLYRTAGGSWVLHWSSAWEGKPDRWEVITDEQAAGWLIRCELFDQVPDELRPAVDAAELA